MRQFQNAKVGDTVRVQFKILEEGSERVQTFEGTLLKIRGQGTGRTLTVRKIAFGIGVERIFPTASPRFAGITSVRRGKVRRAKLYYLRQLSGKSHRVKFAEEETAGASKSTDKTATPPPGANPEIAPQEAGVPPTLSPTS